MPDPFAADNWPLASHAEGVATLDSMRHLVAADRRFGVITGEAGSGKTSIIRAFTASYERANCCRVPPKELLATKTLLLALAEPLFACVDYLSKSELFALLKKSLADTWRLVVIDEADRLTPTMLDLIRDLAEASQAPFCLVGCPSLERVIRRVQPVASRVCLHYRVPPVTAEEVVAVIGHGSAFAETHGIPTWPHATLAAAVKEAGGNLRVLRTLLAQITLAQDTGLVLAGRPDSFQQAAVRKIAEDYLFRVA